MKSLGRKGHRSDRGDSKPTLRIRYRRKREPNSSRSGSLRTEIKFKPLHPLFNLDKIGRRMAVNQMPKIKGLRPLCNKKDSSNSLKRISKRKRENVNHNFRSMLQERIKMKNKKTSDFERERKVLTLSVSLL